MTNNNNSFLRKELLDLQVKADELDSENIKLIKDNNKFENENRKLKSTISELTNQLLNTVERKDFDDLTNKYDKLEEKLNLVDKNYKRSKKENETLTTTYENCLKNLTEIETKYELSKKENIELKNNINELKTLSAQTFKESIDKSQLLEEQEKLLSNLQEENESLKTHINYLKDQNKKNTSIISYGDSFTMSNLSNSSALEPEYLDIVVEAKLRNCQDQLEETEKKLLSKETELTNKEEILKLKNEEIDNLKIELNQLEKQKIELEDNFELELNKRITDTNNLNKEITRLKEELDNLNSTIEFNENELNLYKDELKNLEIKLNNEHQLKLEELNCKFINQGNELKQKLDELNETIEINKKLENNLLNQKTEYDNELIKIKDQSKLEFEELINKHQNELNKLIQENNEKYEQLKIEYQDLELKLNELKEKYDKSLEIGNEQLKLLELKDSKLVELENENSKLKIELTQSYDQFENEIIKITNQLKNKEQNNELEKQIKELKSTIKELEDQNSLLIKRHQDEVFKLSETMNKKKDENNLLLEIQRIKSELKLKDEKISKLELDNEKHRDYSNAYLIQIEQLKANDRERNHNVYLLKQNLNEKEKLIKSNELLINQLRAELKCAEDSFILERKSKERYYRELCNLEKSKADEAKLNSLSTVNASSSSLSSTIERTNSSMTINSINSTHSISNQIQKLQNPTSHHYTLMEDEVGQFMTNTNINDFRKRKPEFNSNGQDDFTKRMNILKERNLKVQPHLRTSYALEFQEQGSNLLNEKIKNSEMFVIDSDIDSSKSTKFTSIASTQSINNNSLRNFITKGGLRFRKN